MEVGFEGCVVTHVLGRQPHYHALAAVCFNMENFYLPPFVVSLSNHQCAKLLIQISSRNPSTGSGRTVEGFEKLPMAKHNNGETFRAFLPVEAHRMAIRMNGIDGTWHLSIFYRTAGPYPADARKRPPLLQSGATRKP